MKPFQPMKIFAIFAAVFVFIGCQNSDSDAQSNSSSQISDSTNAVVTLTEYSDYECPTCGRFYPVVKRLKEHFGDKLKLELRFFPLNMHQFSALAARAAQSAKNQGKFRQMHDMLFKNQDAWSKSGNPTSTFIRYAKELNLNIAKFKKDLNSAKTQKTVMKQKQEGENKGVNATPTFFLDGQNIDPLPRSYKAFKSLIQNYMNTEREHQS